MSAALTAIDSGQRLRGLVSGLGLGNNKLSLQPVSTKAEGELTVINHAADAPVFSGPRMTPFECRTTEIHPAGDHSIVVGEVVSVTAGAHPGEALLYYRGRYETLA